MLSAGPLDRLITLQKPTTAQNAYGETSDQGTNVAKVWAQVKGLEVTIRWRGDVGPAWQLIVADRPVLVVVTVEEIGRRDGLMMKCREKRT